MTDPNAGQVNWDGNDQTIPLVPESGYDQPELQPFAEETLVDPVGPQGPWASGPGLGQAKATDLTVPLPPTPLPPTPLPTTPLPMAPSTPHEPAPDPSRPAAAPVSGYGSAADYSRSAGAAWSPTPAMAPAPPLPPATAYRQPAYADAFPEPNGPAANIPGLSPYSPYAPSGYAGQAWPAAVEPVNPNHGYQGVASSPHPNAAISMVLGILGIVAFGPLAPVAWYLAARGRREMSYDPSRWRPSGMLTAGMVLGIIGTALLLLWGVFFLFIFGMIAAFGG